MRLNRRAVLAGSASLVLPPAPAAAWGISDNDRAIIIDGLGWIDDPYRPLGPGRMADTLAAALRQSGASAFHMTVGGIGGDDPFAETVTDIAWNDRFIRDNAGLLAKATTAADIRRAKAEGRVALLYGLQDSVMIGPHLDRIATLATLGVRFFQPTYNLRTLWGDGALEPGDAGLSKLGIAAIARIEAERVLLDLSHAGRRTTAEAIAAARRPPIISHTGCRALTDNPRNVDDDSLKAVADKGGVVGIYWVPFLMAKGDATPAGVVAHMTHIVNLCGEDHVAIGTDGQLTTRVVTPADLARQQKLLEDRRARGIAAPGEQVGLLNTVPEWNSPRRQSAQALCRRLGQLTRTHFTRAGSICASAFREK
jgi:membrane dipeptidase